MKIAAEGSELKYNVNDGIMKGFTPPNAPITSLDHFENLLDNVIDTDKNVILLGDLNIDLLKAGPPSRISRICERYGIENVVQEPTRITSSTATLLDPIYINNLSILRNSMVLPSFCSDHCPTLIEINFSTARQKAYSKVVYDYDSGDYASANMYLQGKNWNECFKNLHDINKINGLINQEVHHVMDTYIPKRKELIRPRDKPWITTNDEKSAADSLGQDLESLDQWAGKWGVTFNADKTKSMYFTRKKVILMSHHYT
ncbi:unnamed protein product [Mytilus coruscus]|uniref:Endonuclease/exonuclease/phosphatase domain-containing protein n=1 Tax=Mytilus coruscus TaxID=42192 RepID=A0A6J8A5U5_MYTCO|nr:unnamed protein product [Mytilus coruscus]